MVRTKHMLRVFGLIIRPRIKEIIFHMYFVIYSCVHKITGSLMLPTLAPYLKPNIPFSPTTKSYTTSTWDDA